VFDPLAIALIIAFNGLIGKSTKEKSEDDKVYEIYGEKSSDIEDNGKNLSEMPVIVEKNHQNPVEIPVIVENSHKEEPEMEFVPNPEELPEKAIARYDSSTGGYTYS